MVFIWLQPPLECRCPALSPRCSCRPLFAPRLRLFGGLYGSLCGLLVGWLVSCSCVHVNLLQLVLRTLPNYMYTFVNIQISNSRQAICENVWFCMRVASSLLSAGCLLACLPAPLVLFVFLLCVFFFPNVIIVGSLACLTLLDSPMLI